MSRQRKKGTGGENEVVRILNESGLFAATRQPGSGIHSAYPDDVLETRVFDGTLEVRFRQQTPTTIYHWLGYRVAGQTMKREKKLGVKALLCRRNYAPWLLVMPLETFVEVVGRCQRGCEPSLLPAKSDSASS
jgi:Holliday junction resolvase